MNKFKLLLLIVLLFIPQGFSFAENNIDDTNSYAWGNEIGWINFNTSGGDLTVTDSLITGYAWSENYGWINFQPEGSGVTNDGSGDLDGSAWGEQIGWIDFSNVSIDDNGFFVGNATTDNFGTISLNCSNTASCNDSDYKVQTTWTSEESGDGENNESEQSSNNSSSSVISSYIQSIINSSQNNNSQTNQNEEPEENTEINNKELDSDNNNDNENKNQNITNSEQNEEVTSKPQEDESQPKQSFNDLEKHWSKEYVEDLTKKGILSGKSEEKFEPDSFITRAEITKIAILGFKYEIQSFNNSYFSDIEKDSWYFNYVNNAKFYKIVNGYENGTYLPNNFISRAEALAILIRASGYDIENDNVIGEINFPDVPKDSWFHEYIRFAFLYNLVKGFDDGSFKPNNRITRAEASKILYYLIKNNE